MADIRDICVTVAPFYDTTAGQFAALPEVERLAIRENFFHNAAFLAELCGLTFSSDIETQNVGGFLNDRGNRLVEVSHTFTFQESKKDKVDLFAALMADFGYQTQESTISARYLERGSVDYKNKKYSGQEYTIYVNSLDSIASLVRGSGIENFTVNTKLKTISVFVHKDEPNSSKQHLNYCLKKIISKLIDNGNYKKVAQKPVESRYLDRSERTSLYQGWLQNESGLSRMVGRPAGNGMEQMGVQQLGTDFRGTYGRTAQEARLASSYQVRRFRCLCSAIGEAHRRLEREYSNVNRQDLFLANLERKLRRGDAEEFEAMKRSLYNSIATFEEQMDVLREQSAKDRQDADTYKGYFYRILNEDGALAEFRRTELDRYKANILKRICDSMDKQFAGSPYTGLDIEFQYPPYDEDRAVEKWNGHGTVLSIALCDKDGNVYRWSVRDGTLDIHGNHVIPGGGIFNINTGKYSEAVEKIAKEWKDTNNVLKHPDRNTAPSEKKSGQTHR